MLIPPTDLDGFPFIRLPSMPTQKSSNVLPQPQVQAVTSKFSKSTPLHRVLQNQDTKEQDKYMCVKLLLSSLNPPEILHLSTVVIIIMDLHLGTLPLY